MITRAAVVVAAIVAISVSHAQGPATPFPAFPDVAVRNVHRYAAKHRGWPRSKYRVERHRNDEGYAVYYVIYRRDPRARPFTGGGKSFALYCDPVTYSVVKEMHFQ